MKKRKRYGELSPSCMKMTCKECRHKCKEYLTEEKKEKEKEKEK